MVYLLGIVLVAMRFGYGPSLFATVASVLVFDFFMVDPYFSFAVTDFQHVVTFGVMFFVAFVISSLTRRIARPGRRRARPRAPHGEPLRDERELAGTRAVGNLAEAAARHLHEVFDAKVAVLVVAKEAELANVARGPCAFEPDEKEMGVVDWVWRNDKPAGLGTDTLPSADALYVPLREPRGHIGVLGVKPHEKRRFPIPSSARSSTCSRRRSPPRSSARGSARRRNRRRSRSRPSGSAARSSAPSRTISARRSA